MLRLVILGLGGRCSLTIFGIWIEAFEPSCLVLTLSVVCFWSLFIFYIQKFPSLISYPNLLFKCMSLPWNKFARILREMVMTGEQKQLQWILVPIIYVSPSTLFLFNMPISDGTTWKMKMKASWTRVETPGRSCTYTGSNNESLFGPLFSFCHNYHWF